jgi:tetratricopeptide (TPR) repeat protein
MKEFRKPTDATFNQSSDFLPSKIAVDVAGRLYVLATNVNKGFMKYENDTSFTGYIGANPVKIDMAEYIWKRYFMSREQRAASESFVPTEYENLYIDEMGFIYATNTVFSEWELKSDTAKPIRRLNGIGNDILIKNDRYPPIGDLYWKSESIQYGPSKLTDITALDNEIYVAVDKIRGRLFGYDSQGVMLWAFGTKGNADGAFNRPTALDHIGYDLLVLDGLKNSVTVLTPTEYGQLIYDATDTYLDGDYDRSAELWQEVMKLNANYPLAFRGLGRSMLRQEKYLEAMDYFERAHDRDDYGRAFKQYRKIWIEKNVLWIVLILAVLLLVPLTLGRIKKTKWEVIMHEHSKVRH